MTKRDCVLFELGTQRAATDASSEPGAGHLRLLLAKQADQHVAVLYRYVAPEAEGSMEVTSRMMKVAIDEVRVLEGARIATQITEEGGWTWTPQLSGWKDVHALWSNSPGTCWAVGNTPGFVANDLVAIWNGRR